MKYLLTATLFMFIIGLQANLLAQGGRGEFAPQGRGGGRQAGGQQGGARGATEEPAGTAVIRGRVLTADTGTPVRRAQVRAVAAGRRATGS